MSKKQNARDRLKIRLQRQQQAYVDRATQDDRRPISGTCLGYDAEAVGYRIQIPGGGIIRASSLTNGATATGTRLRVNTARGSVLATINGMPR